MTSLLSPSRFFKSAPFGIRTYSGVSDDDVNVTGLGLHANLLLVKNRTTARNWNVVDQGRGATKKMVLNSAADEVTAADNIQAFIDDGVQIGTNLDVNGAGETFVAYGWEAFGKNYGFNAVPYTGGGSARNVGHFLGTTPEFMIVKGRDVGGAGDWYVYHKNLNGGSTPEQWHLKLNNGDAEVQQADIWEDTAPGTTLMRVGANAEVNGLFDLFVAYIFAPVAGVSAFGGYDGTGASLSITGLGFSPNLVVIKGRSFTSPWGVYDTDRGATIRLQFNASAIEATVAQGLTSFDSDGFTVGTANEVNNSAQTYIWMAWA